MKWRLKNKELQKRLDLLTNEGFSYEMETQMEAITENSEKELSTKNELKAFRKGFGTLFMEPIEIMEGVEVAFAISADMMEEVKAYNPNAWNSWPKTEPPKMIAMRLETEDGSRGTKAFFDGRWRQYGGGTPLDYIENVWCQPLRYRPWEDTAEHAEDETERAGGTD